MERRWMLRAIALFKFAKAGLLLAAAFGALELLRPGAAVHARRWVTALAWHLDRRATPQIEQRLIYLTHRRLAVYGVLALCWATLFAIEGVGLWRAKRWAEYLTIGATGSFIPLELYELYRQISWPRGVALGLNLLVVGYLIARVRWGSGRPSLYRERETAARCPIC